MQGPLRVLPFDEIEYLADLNPGWWLDVGIMKTYYGKGYERGDIEYIVTIARWLENRIPGSQVWYGHDATDESMRLFNEHERESILEYYHAVGHEPYRYKRGQAEW
ncbi:hypothetical protein [Thalassoroseus pseudoceratinae]|uniref:hypothetical protein n=1 Tax=Thalassoroseus pseudoceratinae TaxID=2713176 RepID=UPI00142464FB|nr:hypothetical protein [Thalassoroseus pseudoceratinae]